MGCYNERPNLLCIETFQIITPVLVIQLAANLTVTVGVSVSVVHKVFDADTVDLSKRSRTAHRSRVARFPERR